MKIIPKTFTDALFVGILLGVPLFSLTIQSVRSVFTLTKTTSAVPIKIVKENPFDKVQITAKSAYVWDIKNQKVLFSHNASTTLPLASLTKIMTALVATEQAPTNTEFAFQQDSLKEEGDSGLLVGEWWKLKDILDFTLVMSSNDGARAIASAIEALKPEQGSFVDQMNTRAQELQLTTMSFYNPTGLDVNPVQAGGYGSAADVARLYEYVLKNHPDIFEQTTKPAISVTSDTIEHTAINTNTQASRTPSLIASKTGSSDLAGGNLAVALDMGIQHPIVIVVLGSTPTDRLTDVDTLSNAIREYLALEK